MRRGRCCGRRRHGVLVPRHQGPRDDGIMPRRLSRGLDPRQVRLVLERLVDDAPHLQIETLCIHVNTTLSGVLSTEGRFWLMLWSKG